MIKMAKIGKLVKFKIYTRKIKSLFMIYGNSESILVPENNGSPIQISLKRINIKMMLYAVLVIN